MIQGEGEKIPAEAADPYVPPLYAIKQNHIISL